MTKKVRVRFAPSPTGGLHIGGLRTALFNYLFAKKNNGSFILRIEDTDQSRFVEGAEKYINEVLDWAGISPDEGPLQGGEFQPYRQSERKELYKKHVKILLEKGLAYYAFDTPEELEEMRTKLKDAGMVNLNYNSASRMTMKNSLTLSEEEVNHRIDSGEKYVIRMKIPVKEEIRFKDKIRDWVHVHSSSVDDKVLMKSDGLPTYHLANVVDDHEMGITHVIRGEEWLPSAPLHVLLYKYFGWEQDMPQFAHLPLILKPDGNGKLSKRAADKAGFPIFPLSWMDNESENLSIGFREQGYLPEALINFLALLGWNPGTDQELFNKEELINEFSLERIGKAGTKFDIDKAKWFNQQYINQTSTVILGKYLVDKLEDEGIQCPTSKAEDIAELLKTRITFPDEMVELGLIFFKSPQFFDEKVIRKRWNSQNEMALKTFAEDISKSEIGSGVEIQEEFNTSMKRIDVNPGSVMQILRVSLTGRGSGPDLMQIIKIMGPEFTKNRILESIQSFNEMELKT